MAILILVSKGVMVWRQLVGCNEDDGAWSSVLALLAWHKRTRVDTGRWEDKTQDILVVRHGFTYLWVCEMDVKLVGRLVHFRIATWRPTLLVQESFPALQDPPFPLSHPPTL